MGIQIKVPRAVQIRRLRELGLDAADIAKVTGYTPTTVRVALESGQKGVVVPK